jgi:hypothetical protein
MSKHNGGQMDGGDLWKALCMKLDPLTHDI